MIESRWFQGIRRWLVCAAVMGGAAFVAGCGGNGGAGAQGDGGGLLGGSSNAASIQISASTTQIGSGAVVPVNLTATVKDKNNVALENQPVLFSTGDSTSALVVNQPKTDKTGFAQATLTLGDATIRQIVVTATSGTMTSSVTLNVVGSAVTVSGPTSVAFGASSNYTVKVSNSAGTAVAGVPVTMTSAAGNTVAPATLTTNGSGQATFSVTAIKSGTDVLTASSVGAQGTTNLSVSGTVLSVSAPTASQEVNVNTPQVVTVRYLVNGAPSVGTVVGITTTRGTLNAASATTDATGAASVQIQSATAGQATVTATAPDGTTATQSFEFVSRTPASIALQGSPTTVGVNASGGASNSSELLARVRDASGNPVKGVRVDFTADADPSNGQISPGFSVTDSSGIASASFIAGPNPSGLNLVKLRAAIPSTALAATSTLTVAAQAMSVRFNTGNKIEEDKTSTKFRQPWTAVVVDSAGNPVAGAKVVISYIPVRFYKGTYVAGAGGWVPSYSAVCASEDANTNGVLDAGEDLNGNNALDPGNVASAFVSSSENPEDSVGSTGVTDSAGFAPIQLMYPQGFGNWVQVRLIVTTTAPSGSEVVTSTTEILPVMASKLTDLQVVPPGGKDSPWGTGSSCLDLN